MGAAEILGYASMVIALSMVYIGVRKYRDTLAGGRVTFADAFKVGILITLVASVLYVISWMILSGIFFPDFYEQYGEYYINNLREQGMSGEELAKEEASMANYQKIFQNPLERSFSNSI